MQKNSKYGDPIQILISDMKYALNRTQAAACETIAKSTFINKHSIIVSSILSYRKIRRNIERAIYQIEIIPFQ